VVMTDLAERLLDHHSSKASTHSKSSDLGSIAAIAHVTPLATTVSTCIFKNPTAILALAFTQARQISRG
jgi:hypothetical protein